ncbi:MAG TPA: hypothetical protein VK629_05060, partial [Steroidobacteraceae bacterium]|nr:hypothetical protein [Steroidobacteraceae bacterium]
MDRARKKDRLNLTAHKVSLAVLLAACTLAAPVFALEGGFDRTVEIEQHIATFKDGTRGAVIEAGREVYFAGISDPKLAATIADRLQSEARLTGHADKVGQQFFEWMIKALASTGNASYANKILEGARKAGSSVAFGAKDEVAKIEWYRARNEIMANRHYHSEGDDPQISRIMSLVMAEDFSFKLFAAHRMNRDRMLDPRLMEAVNKQVLQYKDSTERGAARDQAKTMGMYIKLLGYSGNTSY